MPFFTDPFSMFGPFQAGFGQRTALWAAPATCTVGTEADHTEYVRAQARIHAMDTNRPDDDAMPEHDPDGTPWAA